MNKSVILSEYWILVLKLTMPAQLNKKYGPYVCDFFLSVFLMSHKEQKFFYKNTKSTGTLLEYYKEITWRAMPAKAVKEEG